MYMYVRTYVRLWLCRKLSISFMPSSCAQVQQQLKQLRPLTKFYLTEQLGGQRTSR